MMMNNNSSSMMKHHPEVAARAAAIHQQQQQQQRMDYRHHGGVDNQNGCSSISPSGVDISSSYNNGKGSVSGVLEISNTNTNTNNIAAAAAASTTSFQPNLHGISVDWTAEDQALLDEGLNTYPLESSSMMEHYPAAAAAAAARLAMLAAIRQQRSMGYHHHVGGDQNGFSSISPSVSGVLESSNNNMTATATTTRFQPNLHGISVDWTPEEQAILDEGLKTYASETSLNRYAKIAVQLKNKTVRDVALRCKWMMKRDFNRRRKDDHISTRKSKERRDKVTDPSAISSHAAILPAIDGVTRDLLRQNAQAFGQISANLATYQIQNNIGLFRQARDNISQILKRIYEPPYVMKQMPALSVKVNEELANSILPQ